MFTKEIAALRQKINEAHEAGLPISAAIWQNQLHKYFLANANNAEIEARDSASFDYIGRVGYKGTAVQLWKNIIFLAVESTAMGNWKDGPLNSKAIY